MAIAFKNPATAAILAAFLALSLLQCQYPFCLLSPTFLFITSDRENKIRKTTTTITKKVQKFVDQDENTDKLSYKGFPQISLRTFRHHQRETFLYFKALSVFCVPAGLCLQKEEEEEPSLTSSLSKIFLIFTFALQGDATL